MKRLILLLLLLSVGLNVGLGITLKRQKDELDALPPWVFKDRDSGSKPREAVSMRPAYMENLRVMRERIKPQLELREAVVDSTRVALRTALAQSDPDEAVIMRYVSGLIAAQGSIDSLITANLVSELKRMTPEERRAVARMIEGFGSRPPRRFGGRHGHRRSGPPPVSP